jgi:hypothetical protein
VGGGTLKSKFARYMELAQRGRAADVDQIMSDLGADTTFADSRFIDYSLGLVKSDEGVERIKHYLFKGTQMQRNYSTLFFNRRCLKGDWEIVKQAYTMGLIDATQAFSK